MIQFMKEIKPYYKVCGVEQNNGSLLGIECGSWNGLEEVNSVITQNTEIGVGLDYNNLCYVNIYDASSCLKK